MEWLVTQVMDRQRTRPAHGAGVRGGRLAVAVLAIVCVLGLAIPRASAQEPPARTPQPQATRPGPRRMPPGGGPGGVSPVEVQRLFDAYFLMQAQQALKISDAQYPQFLIKMRALLELRQKNQQERFRLVRELRDLTDPKGPQTSDAQIKEALQKLETFDAQAAQDLSKAYDAVDQVLDIRQQARLRVFEEQMERRKLELLMRARAGRGGGQWRPEGFGPDHP
ncbi:MAG: hypothetical protein KGN76_06745 [Acidobacteriota bacterium]|nr:hypothetical protein [Acidobacteriota bacterium]